MLRTLIAIPLVLSLCGCLAVLGYRPTPQEIEAIKRGEDPRADESRTDPEPAPAAVPVASDTADSGPAEGIVLRWRSKTELIIEADGRREVVARTDAAAGESLDDLSAAYGYGTRVRLGYPVTDGDGKTVFRDVENRLLATIR